MTNIAKIFKLKPKLQLNPSNEWVLPSGQVGIEIEVEQITNTPIGVQRAPENVGNWGVVEDGSLRDSGAEFVSAPLFGEDLLDALDFLHNYLEEFEPHRVYSFRTSTHIHLDCSDFTLEQLYRFVQLYLITESFLFELSGNRISNEYCIPYFSSHQAVEVLGSLLAHEGLVYTIQQEPTEKSYNLFKQYIEQSFVKYMAFNLLPLVYQGTIEFRHHYGTDDPLILKQWINILFGLKKAAIDYPFDEDPYLHLSTVGPRTLLDELFGFEVLEKYNHKVEEGLWLGTRVAQETFNFITINNLSSEINHNIWFDNYVKKCTQYKFSKKDIAHLNEINKRGNTYFRVPIPNIHAPDDLLERTEIDEQQRTEF